MNIKKELLSGYSQRAFTASVDVTIRREQEDTANGYGFVPVLQGVLDGQKLVGHYHAQNANNVYERALKLEGESKPCSAGSSTTRIGRR